MCWRGNGERHLPLLTDEADFCGKKLYCRSPPTWTLHRILVFSHLNWSVFVFSAIELTDYVLRLHEQTCGLLATAIARAHLINIQSVRL